MARRFTSDRVSHVVRWLTTVQILMPSTGPIDVEPTVFFNTIRNLTACSSAEFTWFYNGPQDITMSLLVTNIDVPRPSATTPTVNVTIGTEVIPRSILFKWDVVNRQATLIIGRGAFPHFSDKAAEYAPDPLHVMVKE